MADERSLAGNFQITCVLTDKRQVVMTGYVYSDDTPEQINHRLDTAQDAIDRQAVRMDMVSKEAQIEYLLANHENTREEYEKLAAKDASTLKSTEKVAKENHAKTLRETATRVESLRSAINAAKKRLNGAAVLP